MVLGTVDHGTHVSASGLVWNGRGAECGIGAVDFRWSATGWVANVEGVQVPGAEMSASLEQAAEGKARLDVAEADVSDVLNWWKDWSEVKVPGSDATSTAPWNISVVSGPVRHGSLSADRLQLEGRLHQGRLEVMSLKADAMGGQLEARGTVDRRRADFEGRMAEVDLPSFLEVTDGLGRPPCCRAMCVEPLGPRAIWAMISSAETGCHGTLRSRPASKTGN